MEWCFIEKLFIQVAILLDSLKKDLTEKRNASILDLVLNLKVQNT